MSRRPADTARRPLELPAPAASPLRSDYTMRTKCAISDAFVRDCVFAYCASVAQYVHSLSAEHCFRLRNNAISDERFRDCALSTYSVFRPLHRRTSRVPHWPACPPRVTDRTSRAERSAGRALSLPPPPPPDDAPPPPPPPPPPECARSCCGPAAAARLYGPFPLSRHQHSPDAAGRNCITATIVWV